MPTIKFKHSKQNLYLLINTNVEKSLSFHLKQEINPENINTVQSIESYWVSMMPYFSQSKML